MKRKIPDDAFEYYLSLGIERSYSTVGKRYGVSTRAVTNKALKEDWKGRMATVEAEGRRRADQRAAESLEEMNTRHLRTLRVVQTKALEALRTMPLGTAMEAVRALDLAIKQERTIRGEPSERTAVTVEETIRREYERWMCPADEADPPSTNARPESSSIR